jgi:hypothetical protein
VAEGSATEDGDEDEIKWEYIAKDGDGSVVHGPYSTKQILDWKKLVSF